MANGSAELTSAPATPTAEGDAYTRLHIIPFDPELLSIVIPATVLPKARNISYHSVQTFPEKRYGFVDIPKMDADKLKKKLNGAVLKGSKLRVEQAKPESIPEPTGEDDGSSSKPKMSKKSKKEKKEKKRKFEEHVVEGVELEDRKVKRGWTVSEQEMIKEKREKSKKDKSKSKSKDEADKKEKKDKRKIKSKYTDAPECLFKQRLPQIPEPKDSEELDGHKKKKRKSDRQFVVHEFEKTTKYPTFLKSTTENSKSKPVTFEEGQGWVDDDGNVVESAKPKNAEPKLKTAPAKKKSSKKAPTPREDSDETSSSGSSSDDDDDVTAPAETQMSVSQPKSTPTKTLSKQTPPPAEDSDETSSSGSSSDEDDDDDVVGSAESQKESEPKLASAKKSSKQVLPPEEDCDKTSSSGSSSSDQEDDRADASSDEKEFKKASPSKNLKVETAGLSSPLITLKAADSSRPRSSSSATSLTIKIPPVTPASAKVHPLEALYKRPQGIVETLSAIATESKPFSFFDENDGMEREEDIDMGPPTSQVPMTPFSKEDFEFRNIRSAAPTPDTAHPTRSYNPWDRQDTVEEVLEEDEGECEEDVNMAEATDHDAEAVVFKSGTSKFQEDFWKQRGELNRAWKKRRKLSAKEKRNRDNRARAARAI